MEDSCGEGVARAGIRGGRLLFVAEGDKLPQRTATVDPVKVRLLQFLGLKVCVCAISDTQESVDISNLSV